VDYLYTIIKNNRYNILKCLQQKALGKEELLALEPAVNQKVYKAKADVYTMVPQLPSKYLPTYQSCS